MQARSYQEVQLASHPRGTLSTSDLRLCERQLPDPGPSDVVIRNRWFRVSTSTKLMASEDAQHVEGIPFPVLKIGDTLVDSAIGEVVSAPKASGFDVGNLVLHPLGWREWAVVDASFCQKLDPNITDPAIYLGHGWTAYAALTRGVSIQAGDTVFVSSGAGAIGAMAGQVARRLGAGRIIGSTSTHDKAAWMRADLGYDAVVVRGADPLLNQLAAAAPDGIDVFVDMVGGEQLAAAVDTARDGARFVLLGALTAELHQDGSGIEARSAINSYQLIIKNVTMRGYSACSDDRTLFDNWLEWQRTADLKFASSRFNGINNAPLALSEACKGSLRGVVIVEL